jgi:hypothetical protein
MQEFISSLWATIIDVGVAVALAAAIAYLMYMVGLILVLRRLRRLTWKAFVPVLNFYAQVKAVNAPSSWFALALTPYVGAVYAGSIAIRLGAIFNKNAAFSVVWLTIGAPIGMFIIARSKEPINQDLLDSKIKLMSIKAIERHRKK